MSLLIIFLSVLMFLDCVLLICLVLLQLPKKEAGAGLAFGSGATDALFGAGSGNVLTKITKYVAGIFFVLAILMAWVAAYKPVSNAELLRQKLTQSSGTTLAPSSAPATTPPATTPADSGLLQLSNLAPSSKAAPTPAPAAASTVKTNK